MKTIMGLRGKASELAYSGKHQDAARIYERILKSPDRDGDTALRLGALRRKFHDIAGAVASFELAADLFRRTGHFGKADAAQQLVAEAQLIPCSTRPRGWLEFLHLARRPC